MPDTKLTTTILQDYGTSLTSKKNCVWIRAARKNMIGRTGNTTFSWNVLQLIVGYYRDDSGEWVFREDYPIEITDTKLPDIIEVMKKGNGYLIENKPEKNGRSNVPPPEPPKAGSGKKETPPVSDTPGRQYHLTISGKQYGPYTAEKIRQALKSGRINMDTSIWYKGQPTWDKIGNLDEFKEKEAPPLPDEGPPPINETRAPEPDILDEPGPPGDILDGPGIGEDNPF